MITYDTPTNKTKPVQVRLDGRKIGTIRPEDGGFRYYPKGQRVGGALFLTLGKCKGSLEGE